MARTKQTAKQRVKERKQFLASNGIFGIADEPGDNTPQKDSRTRYGNAFYQQCTEMKTETSATTDSPRLKEGDTRPLSSGIYLWDWKQDSSCEYKVRGGFLGCTEFAFFANAAIVTTASAGSSSDHLVQLHLQECDNSSDSSNNNNDKRQFCAVLYTKDDVNSWEYHESPDQDLHFTKIPQCINPTIDSHQAAHGEPQQHGGIHSDVWTVQRPDLIPAVKPKLNKLAATTQDRPIPRYQMIIDPNQCERKGKWVPSEFDVTPEAKVKLVGGDRAHWMDTNLIDSVATPVLQAALPLLSKLKRPKLLLEQQRLQVAVKAQRIFLPPSTDEKNSEYIGLWHIDGQHEPVAAVILFYYHVAKDLRGGNMEFLDRKPMMVKTSFASSGGINQFNSTNVREMLRGNDNSRHANCSVPIEEEGTLLVFSNYQMVHRVLKMINQSTTSEASRDFVALFVMDPAAAPLVPARCHLAQQYVLQRTLEGLCLSNETIAHASSDGEQDESKKKQKLSQYLTDKPLQLVLEFAGIVPTIEARRSRRNQLLRSQLKPRGRIGFDQENCVYTTGNGCFTMIGWLDKALHRYMGVDEVDAENESYRSWGLNSPPEEVGRGLSETLSIPSNELAKTYRNQEKSMWCDFCEDDIGNLGYKCTDAECKDFNVCESCYTRSRRELEAKHTLESFRLDYMCGKCSIRIEGIRHHCTKCFDHEICDQCMDRYETEFLGGDHAFVPLRKDGTVEKSDHRYLYGLGDLSL